MTRTDKAGSQQWTAVSSFLGIISTVKRRYVTLAQKQTYMNCRVTRSLYQIPYPATRAATSRVSRCNETKCYDWCLESTELVYIVNGLFCNLCALAALIVCGPLQFLISHLCIFGPLVFLDPIRSMVLAMRTQCFS